MNELLVMGDFDETKCLDDIDLSYFPIWVRVSKIPMGLMTREVGEKIGKKIGKVLRIDGDRDNNAIGRFLRIKVKLDIRKPLMRGVTISVGEQVRKIWCPLSYEFLPNFCYMCGCLSHNGKACSIKLKKDEKAQWGEGLRYMPPKRRSNNKTQYSRQDGGNKFQGPNDYGNHEKEGRMDGDAPTPKKSFEDEILYTKQCGKGGFWRSSKSWMWKSKDKMGSNGPTWKKDAMEGSTWEKDRSEEKKEVIAKANHGAKLNDSQQNENKDEAFYSTVKKEENTKENEGPIIHDEDFEQARSINSVHLRHINGKYSQCATQIVDEVNSHSALEKGDQKQLVKQNTKTLRKFKRISRSGDDRKPERKRNFAEEEAIETEITKSLPLVCCWGKRLKREKKIIVSADVLTGKDFSEAGSVSERRQEQ